ncbi:hypothetical protein BDN72DRAFT_847661 [Pluteus cervinus]|uniref:Uncharacterized protein n=1 Tax=Pluteus cervinus TaxID=181527 RepID=A0ACD3ACC9_9AGAR|nr:hypothetical protein BDN72DRAFT_847661 [Pluteus cervinus]
MHLIKRVLPFECAMHLIKRKPPFECAMHLIEHKPPFECAMHLIEHKPPFECAVHLIEHKPSQNPDPRRATTQRVEIGFLALRTRHASHQAEAHRQTQAIN